MQDHPVSGLKPVRHLREIAVPFPRPIRRPAPRRVPGGRPQVQGCRDHRVPGSAFPAGRVCAGRTRRVASNPPRPSCDIAGEAPGQTADEKCFRRNHPTFAMRLRDQSAAACCAATSISVIRAAGQRLDQAKPLSGPGSSRRSRRSAPRSRRPAPRRRSAARRGLP